VRIELHPEADAEFAAQVEYYDDQQPGLGRRFYDEAIGCLDWIAEKPMLPRMRKSYRRVNLKVFPFYVAYVVEGDLVWVLAIAHGHRRPGYWRERMKSG
jgi:plasmid stabilization system protein ParE